MLCASSSSLQHIADLPIELLVEGSFVAVVDSHLVDVWFVNAVFLSAPNETLQDISRPHPVQAQTLCCTIAMTHCDLSCHHTVLVGKEFVEAQVAKHYFVLFVKFICLWDIVLNLTLLCVLYVEPKARSGSDGVRSDCHYSFDFSLVSQVKSLQQITHQICTERVKDENNGFVESVLEHLVEPLSLFLYFGQLHPISLLLLADPWVESLTVDPYNFAGYAQVIELLVQSRKS